MNHFSGKSPPTNPTKKNKEQPVRILRGTARRKHQITTTKRKHYQINHFTLLIKLQFNVEYKTIN